MPDPTELRARLRDVQQALFGGDVARARQLASIAVRAGHEHPLLFNLAALRAEEAGDLATALALLTQAVDLAPGDLGSRNALGICLQRLERHEQALVEFDRVIAADASLGFAHCNRGRSLLAMGRVNIAEASFLRALELQENHLALASLARIASFRGDHTTASDYADRALRLVPGFPDAVMSRVEAALSEGRLEMAETAIRDLVADPRAALLDRAMAIGLLGDVLDAAGRYDEAMGAYANSNNTRRAMYVNQYEGERGARHHARMLLSYFEGASREQWALRPPTGLRPPCTRHVFLLGFPRSGTTLLEHALDGHPQVCSLEEQELLISGVRRYLSGSEGLKDLAVASDSDLDQHRQAYWNAVRAAELDPAGMVFIDKYPLNTLKLPLIARLFPGAYILFAIRDPRDVVLSCYRRRFAINAPMFEFLELRTAAEFYHLTMSLARRFTQFAPLPIRVVRHEELLDNVDAGLAALCAWLEIDDSPLLSDFAARAAGRAVFTPSTAQLAQGLSRKGIGHWRHYRPHLDGVSAVLNPWVREYSYEE